MTCLPQVAEDLCTVWLQGCSATVSMQALARQRDSHQRGCESCPGLGCPREGVVDRPELEWTDAAGVEVMASHCACAEAAGAERFWKLPLR